MSYKIGLRKMSSLDINLHVLSIAHSTCSTSSLRGPLKVISVATKTGKLGTLFALKGFNLPGFPSDIVLLVFTPFEVRAPRDVTSIERLS